MGARGPQPTPVPEKQCKACGEPLERKRTPNGRLERRRDFLVRQCCDRRCAAQIQQRPPTRLSQALLRIEQLEAEIRRLEMLAGG